MKLTTLIIQIKFLLQFSFQIHVSLYTCNDQPANLSLLLNSSKALVGQDLNTFNINSNTLDLIERLDLSYSNLDSIDHKILPNFSNLSYLILHHNRIQNLTSFNFNISSLKLLDLSHNNINCVHTKAFENLINLETLNLCMNQIRYLNFDLTIKLKVLDVSSNRIKVIAERFFEKLNLARLDLRDNQIVTMNNSGISNLSLLTNLYLSFNKIEYFEENMLSNSIKTLRVLYIDSNRFKSLDFGLEGLVNLEYLSVSDNLIQHLKNGFFDKLGKLEHLNLGFNNLTDTPVIATSLPLLLVLKINNNSFNKISSEFPPRLKTIDLSSNSLKSLPKNALLPTSNLLSLFCTNNKLETIDSIGLEYLAQLRYLNLASNRIRSLEHQIFENISKLTHLFIDDNRIKSLDDSGIQHLQRLKYLKISFNEIKEIKQGLFNNLQSIKVLNMSSNKIVKLAHDLFKNMNKLNTLDISHNHLEVFDEWGLNSLTSLEHIRLDYNRFKYIQDIQINTVSLRHVWISLSDLNKSQICSLDKFIRPTVAKINIVAYFSSIYITDPEYVDCLLTWHYLKKMIRFNIFEDYKLFACIDELKYTSADKLKLFCL